MIKTLAVCMAFLLSCPTTLTRAKMKDISILPNNSVVATVEPLSQQQAIEISTAPQQPSYSDEELTILSHVIYGEAGSTWITDEEQLLVGNVVLNRVNSPLFPDTIQEVVFQPGQYACTWDGNYDRTPDARTVENAKRLLNGERFCPDNVLYQSNSPQGTGIYKQINETCFCYG